MRELFRAAFVIARRDFAATVLSRAFIFFLITPLFPVLLGGVFGGIGARVAAENERPTIAVVATTNEFARLSKARHRLAAATRDPAIVGLAHLDIDDRHPERVRGPDGQRIRTHLILGPDQARLIGPVQPDGSVARQVRLLLSMAAVEPPLLVSHVGRDSATQSRKRALTGQLGQMLLFFLTLLLAGMLLSQVIEEKSNKIIEVIAAAVRIDAMFLGKLFAMLAASVIGIAVWVVGGAIAISSIKTGGLAALPVPAVGWPAFLTLATVYFAMNYLLLGSVFLGIGAQASTAREVQTLSMPVTFAQVIIFGLASTAVGNPNSLEAIGFALFPLSSPLVMISRAAELPDIWPHLLAIAWQLVWVGIILWLAARLFRRSVLKSGPQRKWWKLGRA